MAASILSAFLGVLAFAAEMSVKAVALPLLLAGLDKLKETVGNLTAACKEIAAVKLKNINIVKNGIKIVLDSLSCHAHLENLLISIDIFVPDFSTVIHIECSPEKKCYDKQSHSNKIYDDFTGKKGILNVVHSEILNPNASVCKQKKSLPEGRDQ